MEHKSGSLQHEMVSQLASSTLAERFAVDFKPETLRWEISFSNLSKDEFLDVFLAGITSLNSRIADKWKLGKTSDDGLRALQFVNLSDIEARELSLKVAVRFHQVER